MASDEVQVEVAEVEGHSERALGMTDEQDKTEEVSFDEWLRYLEWGIRQDVVVAAGPTNGALLGMGARFRLVRTDLGLTQEQMLRCLGVERRSVDSLSRLERGDLRLLELDFLLRACEVADARGYNLKWLLLGEGPMWEMKPPTIMAKADVASRLGVSEETVDYLVLTAKLACVRILDEVRFTKPQVDDFISRREAAKQAAIKAWGQASKKPEEENGEAPDVQEAKQ